MSDEWFRNTGWNDVIARQFNDKLRRARRKEQYLRIQAHILAPTHPKVALELLDRYFELPDDFDHAQAYVDRATALRALGQLEEAAESYEVALEREAQFPNVKTQAYLELPTLIATEALHTRYDEALALLEKHADRLAFPVEHFLWHSAHALVLSDTGHSAAASTHARRALEAASRDQSGFRHHQKLGLVTSKYRELISRLEAISAA